MSDARTGRKAPRKSTEPETQTQETSQVNDTTSTSTPAAEATPPAAARKEVERTPVTMDDGRVVEFAGNRQADKTVTTDEATGEVVVQIDFRNGKTVKISSAVLSRQITLQAVGHGLSQKIGDSYASEKKVDDMYLGAEEMVKRLTSGDWGKAREAGDSMSGASIVIRALVEVTGKSIDAIKAFLQGKLDAAKAAGTKLSRQELYNSFRKPGTKTAEAIARLEAEENSKSNKVDANDLLAEIAAA